MFLVKAYNFRQQCLKSQKYLSKFLYPFQYFPPQAIPNNLPDYFPKEPKVYPDKYNCSETEELKIQNTRDTTNDVGLKEEFSKDENLSIIDLTDESVDSSDVYLESDSGIGGRTPENIDSNTNDVKISLLKPISEQALELAQFAESSTLTDCKLPTTSYKHSENSTSFIVPLNKSRRYETDLITKSYFSKNYFHFVPPLAFAIFV